MFTLGVNESTGSGLASAVLPPPMPPALTANADAQIPTSVLGPDISITGQSLVIKSKGGLLVAGQVQGDIHGHNVTVGESGSIMGTITAHTIRVLGRVKGQLKAGVVYLDAMSKVEGDITKQKLVIMEGAQFDGSVRRATDPLEITPDLSTEPAV